MKTVTKTRTSANHSLHLFLSVMTCGLWLLVWPIVAATGKRTKTVTTTSVQPSDLRPQNIRLSAIPAGWYETPDGFGVKYWNGREWVK